MIGSGLAFSIALWSDLHRRKLMGLLHLGLGHPESLELARSFRHAEC